MTSLLADPITTAALSVVVKASVLLSLAAIAQLALRRRASAATRHAIWIVTLAGVLILPVLMSVLPSWPVIVRTTSVASAPPPVALDIERRVPPAALAIAATPAPIVAVSSGTGVDLARATAAAAAIYFAGVALMVLMFALQWWRARRLASETDIVAAAEWTQLLAACAGRIGVRRDVQMRRSRARTMPMVVGIRQPIVVVPAIADDWSDDRRQAVMLHELAHVARYDCLTQALASAACALYWFHPGVWWAARRVRIERELACDDRVIVAGAEAREYASHLLEIAYASGPHQALALAVHMASPRQLEGRLRALLDAARNRAVPAGRMRVAGAVCAAAILWPVAGATMQDVAQAPPKTLATQLKPIGAIPSEPLAVLEGWASAIIGLVQSAYTGTWEVRPTTTTGVVHLRLTELNSSSGNNVPIEQLEGLTAAQLTGAGGPVQFRIRRDAGTLIFEGVVRNGVGAGTFTFEANPAFRTELTKRGFAAPSALEQYQLARHDLGYAFIDELTRQGYARPDIAGLVRAGAHGVSTTYLREMGAEGYRLGTLEPLITLRDHGVTPAYIRGLAELGYKGLPADELQRARDHGVTPEYVSGLRTGGYASLTLAQLIEARDHGVTPDYVRAMRDNGYGSLTIDELINARDHGVDVEYLTGMRGLGYTSLPLAGLVRMRDHGVTPRYVEELKGLGYDSISADDLVLLRDHGATAERIRAANTRAGSRLPIDTLRSLARRGELE